MNVFVALVWQAPHVAAALSSFAPLSGAATLPSVEWIERAPADVRYELEPCELTFEGGASPEAWSNELWIGAPFPEIAWNGHTEFGGQWTAYEQIPRRADRPESYRAYRYPIPDAIAFGGYDLDQPDPQQRRRWPEEVGHGGVDLTGEKGEPVAMVRLEHQVDDAEVIYVGPMYGTTVVTRHSVREQGLLRDYVVIFGHLDGVGHRVFSGYPITEGQVVGYLGDSGSPGLVHLHVEARRARDGVDVRKLWADALREREFTTVTDPRNVLPLRDAAPQQPARYCLPRPSPPARRYWLSQSMALTLD